MSKPIQQVWRFNSDSNPNKEYETLRYTDGSTSCNCAGWTRRVAPDGSRSCKHTRLVDLGRADALCVATHNYDQPQPQPHVQRHVPKKNPAQIPGLGRRRFVL